MPSTSDQSLPKGKAVETDLDRLIDREFSSGKRHDVHLREEAWAPWLTFTDAWNSANAYNLALFSELAYKKPNRVSDLFEKGLRSKKSSLSKMELTGNSLVDGEARKPLTRSVLETNRFQDVQTWNIEGTLLGIEGTDTQAFAASSPDRVLIAIRGTESIQDWIQDAKASTVSFRESETNVPGQDGTMQVHEGFYQAFQDLKPSLGAYLNKHIQADDGTQKPVFVCGHSLGGAVGLLVAAYIRTNFTNQVVLNTYGMPRVAEPPFVKHYSLQGPEPIFHQRHVHHRDPVPALPSPGTEFNWGAGAAAALAHLPYSGALAASAGLQTLVQDYDGKLFTHHGSLVYLPSVQQARSLPLPNADLEDLRVYDLGDLTKKLWASDDIVGEAIHLKENHLTTTYIEGIRRRLNAEVDNYLEATANDNWTQTLSEHSAKYDKLTSDIQNLREEIAKWRRDREGTIDPQREQKASEKIEEKQKELGKALHERATFAPPSPQTYQSFLLQTREERLPESPKKTLQRFRGTGEGA
jgi:hypothetical protein